MITSSQQVKRGYRSFTCPYVCGVSFEFDPVWLWTLRPKEWHKIFISESDHDRLQRHHHSTFALFAGVFSILLPPFDNDPAASHVDAWWISGSPWFVSALSLPDQVRKIVWLSSVGRRVPRELSHIDWISVQHSRVGGVTNARGHFGFRMMEPVTIHPDLQRTPSHVIKYSVRPIPCGPIITTPHYTLGDLLSIRRIDLPVLFSTYMSRTGWGQRVLSASELAACFDLPDFIPWDSRFPTSIVPLQLFRSVMDAVIAVLPSPSATSPIPLIDGQQRGGKHRRLEISPLSGAGVSDGIWLSSINAWLPGTWASGTIATRAVKSDEASVDTGPWNRRITLVFPCPAYALHRLERLAMRKWRSLVVRSFFAYLSHQYGSDWPHRMRPMGKRCHSGPSDAAPSRARISDRQWASGVNRGGKGGDNDIFTFDSSELRVDLQKGLKVLGQVLQSTWWEWSNGSSLFFWRWNGIEQVRASRDGMKIYIQAPLPKRKRGKGAQFDPLTRSLVSNKVNGMVSKLYLEAGLVSSHLHYFAVPKGDHDIRVVYDGTSSGLNEALWSPNFFLPMARNAAELLTFDTWMSDMDFGEFFHNFHMDESIRRHAGVDLSQLRCSPASHSSLATNPNMRWARLFMGMKPSPYNAVRHYYWAEEFARGDPSVAENPLGYDCVLLNLPCMESFDPLLPKVVKWKSTRKCVAGDVITFVDDVRITGSSKENCHSVHRQFTSRMQFLGLQDAPRKFRPPSQIQAGAWTGTIFRIDALSISKTVSQEKWDKGRAILAAMRMAIDLNPRPTLNRKELERHTGFLNHLSMTFEDTTPFLKGFYLSLNSWRTQRDDQDWKMTDRAWLQVLESRLDKGSITEEEVQAVMAKDSSDGSPVTVVASPRFQDDIRALSSLFDSEVPPVVNLRSKNIVTVVYGFGDASGTGLGATFTCGSGFTFRIGVWGADDSAESSNWKEFSNIVSSLEEEAQLGNLSMSEVFMFTDNATVEACSVRGTSSSPKLLDLVIKLRTLSSRHGIKIHIFHVAGTRMIAQGTDGVSRGFLGGGVMSGEAMTSFIPIHLSAVERSPSVQEWIKSWSSPDLFQLAPIDWFSQGHDIDGWNQCLDGFSRPNLSEGRCYLWSPPPFAADVAIAELRKARIKRQSSTDIFVCPRLCSSLWVRHLFKAADVVFEIPPGQLFWPANMHEPLLIGLLFPFIRSKPWQLRSTPKMYAVAGQVRRLFKTSPLDVRHLLRKFWDECHRLRYMPENVVRRLLYLSVKP